MLCFYGIIVVYNLKGKMNMISGKGELLRFEEQIKNNPKLEYALSIYCDFEFAYDIDVNKDILCFWGENQLGISNYDIYPFGIEGSGGYYVLLDDKYVGFISSDGTCGIVASNVYNFFNYLAVFKTLQSYFYESVFDSLERFNETFIYVNDKVDDEYKKVFDDFIKYNIFEKDYKNLKINLKADLTIQPEFIIKPTKESEALGWGKSDDLFSSNHDYIAELINGCHTFFDDVLNNFKMK